jgi:hypothetical protein
MSYWDGAEYWEPRKARRGLRELKITVAIFLGMFATADITVANLSLDYFLKPSNPVFVIAAITFCDVSLVLISIFGVRGSLSLYKSVSKNLKTAMSSVEN